MSQIQENIVTPYSLGKDKEKKRAQTVADFWDIILPFVILICLVFIIYLSLSGSVLQPLLHDVRTDRWSRFIIRPSLVWGLMGSMFLVFRTLLWFWYRPFPAAKIDDAPYLTVIIPAYNEGEMVEKTINSVAAASYPHEKLEIFVIDDGSTDDTWRHIVNAALRYPKLVTPVRFRRNRGKRAALETGFLKAKGEIAVTIDSDSVIEENSLLNIVGPFRDPGVGAVAGKVAVYNRQDGIIPRMLHVRFTLSFDFLRAAQSTYGTVYCCPGALSAYRVAVVREVIEDWMKQTFLGASCTYGEDRSLTNFILSRGFDTVYQRTAVVRTLAPISYKKLSKMYLRWDRSYIKEECRLFGIIRRRPFLPRLITFMDIFIRNLRYPVSYTVLGLLVVMSLHEPETILRFFSAIGLMSSLNILYYLRSERSWDFIYGILYAYFSVFTLFWIFPYALFTLRSRSWMTR
jgi:hyaluronan synthase